MPGQVKDLRENLGLRQEDLASILGVPKQSVSKWETGNRLPPARPAEMLRAIETGFRRNPKRAVEAAGKMPGMGGLATLARLLQLGLLSS